MVVLIANSKVVIKMTNYYVTTNEDGTWNARRENSERASGVYSTQAEAEQEAKGFSANSGGGEVRIQGRDGKFRDSDTVFPGNDPFPPKDNKH
ncbi:DUF2188 domain-containing protein [soil metagenome]